MSEKTNTARPSQADMNALDKIISKANKGDRKALAKLSRFLDDNPHVWQQVGDLAQVAERAWSALASNGSSLSAEALKRQLNQIKKDLVGESTTVIEQMLADTVVATWLELHHLRTVDADTRGRSVTQGSLMLKRLESAQRRHHNALKQLTQIRKLLPNRHAIPQLQVFPRQVS